MPVCHVDRAIVRQAFPTCRTESQRRGAVSMGSGRAARCEMCSWARRAAMSGRPPSSPPPCAAADAWRAPPHHEDVSRCGIRLTMYGGCRPARCSGSFTCGSDDAMQKMQGHAELQQELTTHQYGPILTKQFSVSHHVCRLLGGRAPRRP